MLQQSENAKWSSRDKARQTNSHSSHIDRMEAIHILAVIYSHRNLLLINVLRQRQLHDEAINATSSIDSGSS